MWVNCNSISSSITLCAIISQHEVGVVQAVDAEDPSSAIRYERIARGVSNTKVVLELATCLHGDQPMMLFVTCIASYIFHHWKTWCNAPNMSHSLSLSVFFQRLVDNAHLLSLDGSCLSRWCFWHPLQCECKWEHCWEDSTHRGCG